jgi:hypothetical protein
MKYDNGYRVLFFNAILRDLNPDFRIVDSPNNGCEMGSEIANSKCKRDCIKRARLVSLPVLRRRHHGETGGMDASVLGLLLCFCFRLVALLALSILLLLAFALLHLELCALFSVAGALVVELVVLGYDLGFAAFAVATTAGTGVFVSKIWRCLGRMCLPQLNVDLSAFLLLAVGEYRVVVLL